MWTIEKDLDDLIICHSESELEIPIKKFNPALSIPHTLPQEVIGELVQLGVKYPLEEYDNRGKSITIYLEVIITGNDERRTANLHLGNNVSWRIPVDFAEQLQAIFLLQGVLK